MASSLRNPSLCGDRDAVEQSTIEELEDDIEDSFEIVRRLGNEMLFRRRENARMRRKGAQRSNYLNDLTHIGIRLSQRIEMVRGKISALTGLFSEPRAPLSKEERGAQMVTLRHMERIERALRRWDQIQTRLTVH